jgi:CRP/FNR family transcriptional regulator
VEATHQDLAGELGSVREVVTRVLRRFEKEALIRVERGRISICDARRLESLARASGDLVTDTGPIRP